MLDMRYNEVWRDWGDINELLYDPKEYAHGQLVLSWKKLDVSVKQTVSKLFRWSETSYKQLLLQVSGNVQSGTLLGIMGPSGSGKTTLLSTISHRTKGNFKGELLLNGKPITDKLMIKMSGFIPQHDINFDQLTALEHLTLMARLKTVSRRRSTGGDTMGPDERVNHVVYTLGMDRFLDTRIALLSGGERKKVALAVQLLDDPPMLFCDEITTGLDSYTAAHIVNTLRAVARTGKIVVCTIHQPASGVFDKFDDVALLADGRLAYHGPVSMVNQFFHKFDYKCPHLFNEADFVISILNSDDESVKKNVDKMCELSSNELHLNINCDLLNIKKQIDHEQQTQKPSLSIHFWLIFIRSIKCFLRSYKTNLLDLATTLMCNSSIFICTVVINSRKSCIIFCTQLFLLNIVFEFLKLTVLGVVISLPFSNLKFDTNAVQNWEGFWLIFVINFVFHFSFAAISIYQVKFSVIHREVHNNVYPLIVFYLSELLISIVWTTIKMLVYCMPAFWIVGIEVHYMKLFIFFIMAMACFSYGSLLSSYFNSIENAVIFATVYNSLAMCLCGAYLSFISLPKVLYSLRYLSIFFLCCEMVSIEFWVRIKSLPCIDITNCLNSGEAVLRKYGYISQEFNVDILIMALFCLIAQVCSYYGLLKKIKKQPAY